MDKKLETIREAVADLIRSTGCGCCGNRERMAEAERILAGLLEVPMYDDGSGYRFLEFCSDEEFVERIKNA